MVLVNDSGSVKYSGLAKTRLRTGESTRDLDVVQKFVDGVLSGTRGLRIRLSDRDFDAIERLCKAHSSQSRSRSEVSAMAMPSGGRKSVEDRASDIIRGIRIAKQREFDSKLKDSREREARIRAESNIIGPDGNPVNDRIVQDAVRKDIAPELHPEMTSDLDNVLANNLAVMQEEPKKKERPVISLGLDDFRKPHEPGKNSIVAKPDGSPVSHDPSFYQKAAKSVPPGVPDLPGAGEQYMNASKWKPAPGMPQT